MQLSEKQNTSQFPTHESKTPLLAMALSDDENRQAADRILRLLPTYDPALAEGIADIRTGHVTDADDLNAELEAAD